MKYWWPFAVFLTIVTVAPSPATTYVIRPDGTGDHATIQAAIDASAHGDIIELTDGIFVGDGNRDIDYLGKAVTIRSQSGNPRVCEINCGGSAGSPHRGFYFHSGEGNGSVLECVTITNAFSLAPGGGISCDGASPTITDCILSANQCPDNGAGLLCSNASPILTRCSFVSNGDGTGIGGAGMACLLGSAPVLTDCTFEDNRAQAGGAGLFCGGGSNPSLTGCTFSENIVTAPNGYGGGLFCFYYSSPILVDCDFTNNSSGLGGGAAFYDHCDPSLTNCVFSGNTAENGGGVYALTVSLPTLDGCTFSNNTALYYGGAVWCSASSPTFRSCTLSGNAAGTNGGGIHLNQSSPTVEKTIIAFSTSGAAIYCYDATSSPVLTCCDVYGNAGGDWVGCIAGQYGSNGNISEDPLFCSAVGEIFTLHNDSPCAEENNPECDQIGAFGIGCGPSTDVAVDPVGSRDLFLSPSWPNPSSEATMVSYTIARRANGSRAVLSVHDPAGRLIRTLVDADQLPGSYRASWDGTNEAGERVAAGVYLYQLRVSGKKQTRQVILVR